MKQPVRILVVEDEPASLNLLEKQLQARGDLVTVPDPRQAAEIAGEGAFDLLIAAGHLLGEAPWVFFSRVAEAAPRTLRVLSAGHREAQRTLLLMQSGLLHYHLPKPLRVRMLNEVLPRLLALQRTLPATSPFPPAREDPGDTASLEYVAQIVENLNSGLIVVDPEGRIVLANTEASRILGYERRELTGMAIDRIFYAEEDTSLHPVKRTFERGELMRSLELKGVHKDGHTLTVGLSTSLHTDRTGKRIGVICIFRDLSGMQDFQSLLIRNQRMAAIGQLAGGIAHEFNNLIGGMMGYAQLAQMTQAEEDYRKCVEVVVRSSKRAGEITAGLLSIARRDSGKVEETSLSSVLQEPLALMKRDLEKQKITVHLEFESDPLLVTSVGKLQQVFIALIRNAIDAMPRGGDLIFRSRRIDDQLEIRVIDTGEGISEENLAMLFSPFFTTKGSLGGSSLPGKGLDLAVSFAIMESLKGSIRAESTLGKGTTFILTLPLMLSGEILPQIGSRSHPTTPIPKSSPKVGDILIIDDEETVLGMLKKSLELDQHRVVTTQNGLKALEYAEIHHFDLAVIDVRMPIINGWETLERLKTIDPAIKAIIMSANPGDQPIEEMIEKSRQLGAQRYIRKPFDLREFKRIVSEVLAS